MGMPRLSIIFILLASGAMAETSCRLSENDVLRERYKRCGAEIVKISCNGSPVDVKQAERLCCEVPESRQIDWRCGGDPEPDLVCPRGSTALLATSTEAGARFRCLKMAKAEEPAVDDETDVGSGDETGSDDSLDASNSD